MNEKGNLELIVQQIENGFVVTISAFPRKNIFFEKESDAKEYAKTIIGGW